MRTWRASTGWRWIALGASLAGCFQDDVGGAADGGGAARDAGRDAAASNDLGRDGAVDAARDAGAVDTGPAADAGFCADGRRRCDGVCCAMGEACAGGFCCADAMRCGGVCCGPGRRCEGGQCARDCGATSRCGARGAEVCCAAGQVCYLEGCVTPGAMCDALTRCPDGQVCERSLGRCLPRAQGEACEFRPPVGTFTPEVRWSWSGDPASYPMHNQVMMAPMVVNLTDDNGDGRINADDVPDVVFNTFVGSAYWNDGILRAVSGDTGNPIWPRGADPGYRTTPGSEVALGDIDPTSPGPEIVACSASNPTARTAGYVIVLRADGRFLRALQWMPCGFSAPSLADLDGDGRAEIVVRGLAARADGTPMPGFEMLPRPTAATSVEDYAIVADLEGDGRQEIILGNRVIRADGTTLWDRSDLPGGHPAVADLDRDGSPEVVVVQGSTHSVIALRGTTGETVWGPVEVNRYPTPSGPSGGGPPTIADFDGDGAPDVATAGGYNYLVLRGRDGTVMWSPASRDTSSWRTGSSVFDFEGDGAAEVVYNDELSLRVYRGRDGTVLYETCNTSGTLTEYPVIVDVDNDNHADMVVMQNNYHRFGCVASGMAGTGIRVLSDPRGAWVRTRRIWNQHGYAVTNVNEDGTIPARPRTNWRTPGLNNFRQNVQPDGLFDAPDLVAADLAVNVSGCPQRYLLAVRVVNRGRAGAPAGIPVTFYRAGAALGDGGTDALRLGRVVTTRRLLPGESEVVSFTYMPTAPTVEAFEVWATVNARGAGDMPLESLRECRPDNNTSARARAACVEPG